MKKIIFNSSFYLFLLAVSLLAFSGCKKDEDDNTKADFVGTYSTVDVCDGDSYTYSMRIADVSGNDDAITINNLWAWEETMNATVSGNTLTLPSQVSDGVTFSGSGTLTDDKLVITFTASDGTGTESCVATATKQ